MATARTKRSLVALNKKNCEKHPRSNVAQNLSVPRSQEDYIIQISEEIEGRVTKKLSQQFSMTENCILGALSRLNDFLMNPLTQGYSRTAPETSRNAFGTNQGTNEDDSQSDPNPEAGIFHNQTTRNSGPEGGHDTDDLLFLETRVLQENNWVKLKKSLKERLIQRNLKIGSNTTKKLTLLILFGMICPQH